MLATTMKIMMMAIIIGVIESNPTPTPIDHAFSDARTITTHARHGHLLHGMMGDLESYVFDDVVEFLFQQLGEELPQARSHQYYRHPDYNFEGGDNYPLPSQYSRPQPEDKSCISMGGDTNSIMCLNVLTALSIAGLGLLLQFLFFAGLSTLSSNNLSNSTSSGSEPNNISNVFSVTASNDVSVEQNDDIDIINRPDFEDDRLRSGIQRSDLDEDVNLGEDGGSNDFIVTGVRNQDIIYSRSFNVTTNEESEDASGEKEYMYYENDFRGNESRNRR
ncbi:uncharacterized protein LOC123506786 [Portunus trituberculatus]|uniref:uncharacterized protein LOC123506786 n=1 Tax=Portunus trituberculatus TaxID=210409 RepID=UPI001E1CCC49|nr:uncharacterized protein LOC123506786 [Portunus trituberculatus]